MKNEALERKQRSIEILKKQGVPFIEHLPVVETKNEVKIRTKDEIAKRAITCLISIQLACDIRNDDDVEGSKEFMKELLKKYKVEDCLTQKEKNLFVGNPDRQDLINMAWKYEAYWVLLWSLGVLEELPYPSEICDCDFAIQAVSSCESYEEFMEKVELRSMDEILDELDLTFRYDWACVEARIHGKEAPQSLDSSVVVERHRAFNWIVDFDKNDDWDDVSTNT